MTPTDGTDTQEAPRKDELKMFTEANKIRHKFITSGGIPNAKCEICTWASIKQYSYDGTCTKGYFSIGRKDVCEKFFSGEFRKYVEALTGEDSVSIDMCLKVKHAFGRIRVPGGKIII